MPNPGTMADEGQNPALQDWVTQEAQETQALGIDPGSDPDADPGAALIDTRLQAIEDKLDALLEPLFDVPSTEDLHKGITQIDVQLGALADRLGRGSPFPDTRGQQMQRSLAAFGQICRRQDMALDRLTDLADRIELALEAAQQSPQAPVSLVQVTQSFEKTVAEMLMHLKQVSLPQPVDIDAIEERLAQAMPQPVDIDAMEERLAQRMESALAAQENAHAPVSLVQVTRSFEKTVAEMLMHLKQVSLPQPVDIDAMEERLAQAIGGAASGQVPAVAPELMRMMQVAVAELLADTARQTAGTAGEPQTG